MIENKINSVAIFVLSSIISMNFQLYKLFFSNFTNILINKLSRCLAIFKVFNNVIAIAFPGFLFLFDVINLFLSIFKDNKSGGGGNWAWFSIFS